MQFFLVKFAPCHEGSSPLKKFDSEEERRRLTEPRVHLISEETHDRWCEAEPQEGYGVFETLCTMNFHPVSIKDRDEILEELKKHYG